MPRFVSTDDERALVKLLIANGITLGGRHSRSWVSHCWRRNGRALPLVSSYSHELFVLQERQQMALWSPRFCEAGQWAICKGILDGNESCGWKSRSGETCAVLHLRRVAPRMAD